MNLNDIIFSYDELKVNLPKGKRLCLVPKNWYVNLTSLCDLDVNSLIVRQIAESLESQIEEIK